jgi:pyruvate formate lyase activating enzyme
LANSIKGRVFNIQRYSLHDGTGIRTLVFLKGCPLRCLWCGNPESQRGIPQLGFISSSCVGAGACGGTCLSVCPVAGGLRLGTEDKPIIDRQVCDACGLCAKVCREGALKVVGRDMSVDEVLAEVEKDRPFYRRSGGGITIGGGEPLLQHRFTSALLEAAHGAYLHTALETCGHAPWKHFEPVLEHVDLLHIDLKHMDPVRHRELTGQSNELVIDNLRRVLSVKSPQEVIVRIPVIPGCNESMEDIRDMTEFVMDLGFTQIELIPYHKMGISKYAQYDMDYPLPECESPSESDMARLREIVPGEAVGSI